MLSVRTCFEMTTQDIHKLFSEHILIDHEHRIINNNNNNIFTYVNYSEFPVALSSNGSIRTDYANSNLLWHFQAQQRINEQRKTN